MNVLKTIVRKLRNRIFSLQIFLISCHYKQECETQLPCYTNIGMWKKQTNVIYICKCNLHYYINIIMCIIFFQLEEENKCTEDPDLEGTHRDH